MISKLIPSEYLDSEDISHLHGHMSGVTLGLALSIVGDLMSDITPYEVCVKGKQYNRNMDENLFRVIQDVIGSMGLKHFKLDKKELTIRYDIWRDDIEG